MNEVHIDGTTVQLVSLADLHAEPPGCPARDGKAPRGWCDSEIVARFKKHLSGETDWVLNGGVYFGRSCWEMARIAPNARIICLDHFKGSVEHQGRKDVDRMYQVFVSNCWEYRDRLYPLVADSAEGMAIVKAMGITPAMVFIDMSHDPESVARDTLVAAYLFPDSIICGDDYNRKDVPLGVARAAAVLNRPIRTRGPWWVLA
jgi:hypothetical protein